MSILVILLYLFAILQSHCSVQRINNPYEHIHEESDNEVQSKYLTPGRFSDDDDMDDDDDDDIDTDKDEDIEEGVRTDDIETNAEKDKAGGQTYTHKLLAGARPIRYKTQKITPLTLPTPPLRTTRSFRDHFQTVKFHLRHTWTSKLSFPSKQTFKTSAIFTTPRPTLNSFAWKNIFLPASARPPWYSLWNIGTTSLKSYSKTTYTFPKRMTISSSTTCLSRTTNVSNTTIATTTIDLETIPNNPYYELLNELDESVPIVYILRQQEETTTTNASNTTTTTTTTRTTRTYPYPNWICYECGRNETKFGSSLCHTVFEMPSSKGHLKRSMHYKCNGHKSVRNQCFKRFLDIGDYNERGCRDWPPRKSGRTYASKRLRALEKLLQGVEDGCVASPHAVLVPFSRTIELYARFYVCVCQGTLCNTAAAIWPWSAVFLNVLVLYF